MTICKRCVHLCVYGFDCEHPTLRRKEVKNFVSGATEYIDESGERTGCEFPRAYKINTNGNCPLYEHKIGWMEWIKKIFG